MTSRPVVALKDVSRSFGPVEVLHGVNLALYAGSVHALIGENGAGKSTTMKILAGYQPPTSGEVFFEGQPTQFKSLHDGEMAGIVMIHQEFNLAEQLTVEQNIFLGRELRRGPLLDKAEMRRRTRDYLVRVACDVSPDTLVSQLSNSEKQMVEIAKALSRDARVLIMDEPNRGIDIGTKQQIYTFLGNLVDAGHAIIVISSEMPELIGLADRVMVMRLGVVSGTLDPAEITEDAIVRLPMGLRAEQTTQMA